MGTKQLNSVWNPTAEEATKGTRKYGRASILGVPQGNADNLIICTEVRTSMSFWRNKKDNNLIQTTPFHSMPFFII